MHSRVRVALTTTLTIWAVVCAAHPSLVSSSPKAGQALDASPSELCLKFSEAVEPNYTTVKILDGAGKELSSTAAKGDLKNPNQVIVPIPELPAGSYRAVWSAAGRDGHRVKGEFAFPVK